MKKLWAPWRMAYIQNIDTDEDEGCIFCTKPKACTDRENLILHRGATCFIIMNKYPYNNGHLMIVPYTHTSSLDNLDDATVTELWRLTDRCCVILKERFRAEGFNVGMNIGRIAGAGIDEHLHQHIVPRWDGDTNFMPVLGEVKVISQGLFEAYDQLKPAFDQG